MIRLVALTLPGTVTTADVAESLTDTMPLRLNRALPCTSRAVPVALVAFARDPRARQTVDTDAARTRSITPTPAAILTDDTAGETVREAAEFLLTAVTTVKPTYADRGDQRAEHAGGIGAVAVHQRRTGICVDVPFNA